MMKPQKGRMPHRPWHQAHKPKPPPPGSEDWPCPWAQIKYFRFNSVIFRSMVGATSPDAKPGDWVRVYDPEGKPFGEGLLNNNRKAAVGLRILRHGADAIGEDYLWQALARALELRRDWLGLGKDPQQTNVYRVVHSDGDGLSGLVVDRFGDTLMVEVHALGIWQRLPRFLQLLHEGLGTTRHRVNVDPEIAAMEGIKTSELADTAAPNKVKVRENGLTIEVDFAKGHKTGFFCDQRDNRARLRGLCAGKRVLDLCCYTGGFALSAVAGGASEVTAVDLDENAIAQAKRNANLNGMKIRFVHADTFPYCRQMQQNGELWDVVVLDPPKLILSRETDREGIRKYEDFNSLAASLLRPGGLLVTCSCSGLLNLDDFERAVTRGVHRINRRLQYLDLTGPGGDHPVFSNSPESRYLKVYWGRVY